MRQNRGFTLIELLITVVVLGIIAGIAYPSYQSFAAKARRSDATVNLMRIAGLEEKYQTECGVYTPNFNGAISGAARCTGLGIGASAGSYTTLDGHYTYTIAVLPGPAPLNTPGGGGFTITAVPTPGDVQYQQDASKCTTFTLSNLGVKAATGSESSTCWKK